MTFLAIKAFLVAIICTCVAYLFFVIGPTAETRYWPVVSKLKITYVSAYDSNTSYVSAEFKKDRECDYVGISWFKLDPNGSLEQVPLIPLRRPGDMSPPNRPKGRYVVGPWHVYIPSDEVLRVSVVEIFHRCHPFWTTRTQFYP